MAAAAGTLAADGLDAPAGASDAPAAASSDGGFGVLMDASVCISCRKCEWACDRQNHLTDKPQNAFEDRSVCLNV